MSGPKILVLVTDDDDNWRGLLRDVLSMEGFEIEEARDGLQCLEKAKSVKPQAILLDVDLPRMDGWQACEKIKASPDTKDIPIIFISTHAGREEKEKGIALGAASYMPKPVDIDDIVPVLKKLVKAAP